MNVSWFQRWRSKWGQWGVQARQMDRQARAQHLLKGVPPVSCQSEEERQWRNEFETTMGMWDSGQWEAYDRPWLTLLEEILQDPHLSETARDEELKTLARRYERAHWPGRYVKSRPDDLPLSQAVWSRLQGEEGLALPDAVLSMASLANRVFYDRALTWAMLDPSELPLRKLIHAFRYSVRPGVLLKTWPDAPQDRLRLLWSAWDSRDRVTLLKAWLQSPEDDVRAPLAALAEWEHRHSQERRRSYLEQVWTIVFVESMQEALVNGATSSISLMCQRLAECQLPVKNDALRQAWQNAFEETLETFKEDWVLTTLDRVTEDLELVLPLREWYKNEQWNDRDGIPWIRRLPETQARWDANARAVERERVLKELNRPVLEAPQPNASTDPTPRRTRLRG